MFLNIVSFVFKDCKFFVQEYFLFVGFYVG